MIERQGRREEPIGGQRHHQQAPVPAGLEGGQHRPQGDQDRRRDGQRPGEEERPDLAGARLPDIPHQVPGCPRHGPVGGVGEGSQDVEDVLLQELAKRAQEGQAQQAQQRDDPAGRGHGQRRAPASQHRRPQYGNQRRGRHRLLGQHGQGRGQASAGVRAA